MELLTQSIQIGLLTLKNRMIFSPLASRLSTISGEVTDGLVTHYAARAKGGAAMLIVEATAIDGHHLWPHPHLGIYDNNHIPGMHRLVNAIHLNGTLACIQLHHPGMWGSDPVSPSGVPCVEFGVRWVSPRSLTLQEIQEIPKLFADAAKRAQHVGFDAVELHGGTAYLLQQFVSPHTNLRVDNYGGTLEKRWQLSLEVIDEIQKKCGKNFPIGYTVVADELLPDGLHFESDVKPFVRKLKEVGVSYVRVQLGTYDTFVVGEGVFAVRSPSPGAVVNQQAELKKEIGIPILVTFFNSGDPKIMEEALQKGWGDAMTMGRPLLADPDLPRKIIEGRVEDIRQCTRCGHCLDCWEFGWQLGCQQNIEAGGKEIEYAIHPALNTKKVLVIGGGPAGLEVARVAALRGHKVTLMEKDNKLGGSVLVASLPIGKEVLKPAVIDWLERQCKKVGKKVGVEIQLNKEAKVDDVTKMRPDVVIVATGSIPMKPQIPGAEKKHVATAEDVLTGRTSVGNNVVVLGGGQVGVETADFIAERGLAKSVTIVEMLSDIARDMELVNMAYILQKLPQFGIRVFTNTHAEKITDEGVEVCDKDWNRQTLEADTVVLAIGYTPDNRLVGELRGKVPELYSIGSCAKPRKIIDAIHEGSYLGRTI